MSRLATVGHLTRKWAYLNWNVYRSYRQRRKYHLAAPDYWSRLPDLVYREHAPVFVLSTGRCGTELLSQLFSQIPEVLCYHEPEPRLLTLECEAYQNGQDQFDSMMMAIRAARFELIADCVVRGQRYVETNHRLTFFAPHLYRLFPQARFVHLVRHPASFVRSAAARKYYEGQYTDLGRITPHSGPAAEAWPDMSAIERSAWLWNETNSFVVNFREQDKSSRLITVKSEDLFRDVDTTTSIIKHCGLPSLDKRTIARRIKKPTNAQFHGFQLPRYQDWDEAQKAELRRWSPAAADLGYEL